MSNDTSRANQKSLLRILVAVAWIDGQVQTEERNYLLNLAQAQNLLEDPDLKPLLYGLKALSRQECYDQIEAYLGTHPSTEAANELIEAVSGLIYSDGEMASEEAKLVSRLLNASTESAKPHHFYDAAVNAVQHLYQRWRQASLKV